MLTIAFYLVVAATVRFSVRLVSCYAHVSVPLSVVIFTLAW